MARKTSTIDSLTRLFDESSRPIYAVDSQRRIVYCNRALASWIDVDAGRIIGRLVEYHSEPVADDEEGPDAGPLADLCPPPRAFAGEACFGTLSCTSRGGGLIHRRAEFVPLGALSKSKAERQKAHPPEIFAVLALLDWADMSAPELAAALSAEPSADELHRTIRRFRRAQTSRYSIASILGTSAAMQKVRNQVAAAAASGANVLVCGRRGSGRGHVARAIHYATAGDNGPKLVPIDCETLTDDLLRRVLEGLRGPAGDSKQRPTLLLENLDQIPAPQRAVLFAAIVQKMMDARILATVGALRSGEENSGVDVSAPRMNGRDDGGKPSLESPEDAAARHALSTITIDIPRLVDRIEDLPLLAQYFLESCNHGSGKQVGSFRTDALDLLALYSWPGELDQLRGVIAAAHRACTAQEILPTDLPPIMMHAFHAARQPRRPAERIVLDELLAHIEKEAIVRALVQAGGNKSEAAVLLGMTRPRLYRRLVQLGLAREGVEGDAEQPEFIEGDATE